ncbi:hypothetical protein EV421DRAFT_2024119 [Armillaria borealis]|uniref:Uncharacterized protein n=1 Tax=Armillaria borealis TaxID=47425 RepID=A0AA39MG16_9AGAR|nr:hypothetical protein EV421DRAFT_2024119 [Armillaria borealis]
MSSLNTGVLNLHSGVAVTLEHRYQRTTSIKLRNTAYSNTGLSAPSVDSPLISDMHQNFVIILILLFVTRAFGAQTSPDDNKGVPACIEDQHTVLSIIWSCLATIFACTWIAVHPNVPGRNITTKGAISCAIERAKIMAITILAPEVIVGWAAEQFIVAWKLRHGKYNSIVSATEPSTEKKEESKLTLAHGFLLCMGGFYYTGKYEIPHQALEANEATSTPPPSSVHESLSDRTKLLNARFVPDGTSDWETRDVPGTLVTLEALESEPLLVTNLAAISPETIEDRSEGDALSKTVSILQISWFIVQCVARAMQHLPITLLEMTSLAFAGLNIITYFLWWYKPLNVKYPIYLDGSDKRPTSEIHYPEESASPVKSSWLEWAYRRVDWVGNWIACTTLGYSYLEIRDGACRFYSGTTREGDARCMAMVGVGFLFGAFHCVAWSFYFPSHAEMVLWRFSSMAVLIGLCVGSQFRVGMMILDWVDPEWTSKPVSVFFRAWRDDKIWVLTLVTISNFMFFVAIVAYIVARIILIILAFLQLRSLPPLAFCTVQWTTYIPHI